MNWEKELKVEGTIDLKPLLNYKNRSWEENKIEKALQNYKKIVEYYKGVRINLKDDRGIQKYFDIRKKFWDVEQNLRMISEDMYTKIINLDFPSHYYEYLAVLKEDSCNSSVEKIKEKRKILKKVKILRKKN